MNPESLVGNDQHLVLQGQKGGWTNSKNAPRHATREPILYLSGGHKRVDIEDGLKHNKCVRTVKSGVSITKGELSVAPLLRLRTLSRVASAMGMDLMRLPTHLTISLSQLATRLVGHTTMMRLQAGMGAGTERHQHGQASALRAPRCRRPLHALTQHGQHERDALETLACAGSMRGLSGGDQHSHTGHALTQAHVVCRG